MIDAKKLLEGLPIEILKDGVKLRGEFYSAQEVKSQASWRIDDSLTVHIGWRVLLALMDDASPTGNETEQEAKSPSPFSGPYWPGIERWASNGATECKAIMDLRKQVERQGKLIERLMERK